MKQPPYDDRRVAKMFIDLKTLDAAPDHVRALMGEFLVFRGEHLYHLRGFEYVVQSPHLDERAPGVELPEINVVPYTEPSLRSVATAGVMLRPLVFFDTVDGLRRGGPQSGCLALTELGADGRIVVRWPGRTS